MASRRPSQALNPAPHQPGSAHAQLPETSFVCGKKCLSPPCLSKLPSPSPHLSPLSGLGLFLKKAGKPRMLLLLPPSTLHKTCCLLECKERGVGGRNVDEHDKLSSSHSLPTCPVNPHPKGKSSREDVLHGYVHMDEGWSALTQPGAEGPSPHNSSSSRPLLPSFCRAGFHKEASTAAVGAEAVSLLPSFPDPRTSSAYFSGSGSKGRSWWLL